MSKVCHFHQRKKKITFYSSHYAYMSEKKSIQCTSVICTDLNEGLTIEEIWKKEYKLVKKKKVDDE